MSETQPSTELSKHYDHKAAEARWYPFWESNGYFHADTKSDREPYTIDIPLPNVTGALHLGHALNNTLQDVIIRWKRMQGYETLWMPGTDHAGIATQAVVERRLFEEENLTRHDLGREGLVERIWKWKESYEARILGQLKRMGCSCDWERTHFTLDATCARAVRHTFFSLFKDGLIYRGKRLVNWDTFLQTAVSDDEVFHEPVQGHFWHIRYPVVERKPGEPDHIVIATTRPETMLGDTAVAVHPDPGTALDKVANDLRERLAAAPAKEKADLQNQLDEIERRRRDVLPHLEQLRDMALRGAMLELPLTGRRIPLIADIWAKPEMGSGCVKITPGHDQNDYDVWQRNPDIGVIDILHPNGTLNESVPEKYRGMTVNEARDEVVTDLGDLVVDIEDREIDLAHSDRSKTPIEPYRADQWFVKMDHLAQTAIDAVRDGRVKITPKRYEKGYFDWLSEKRDWPVSRQLWWGHRIPIWTREISFNDLDNEGKQRLTKLSQSMAKVRAKASPEQIEELNKRKNEFFSTSCPAEFGQLNKYGKSVETQILFSEDLSGATVFVCVEPMKEWIEKELVNNLGFQQEDDVLDTWFSSALWPHSTLGWPEETEDLEKFYPTSTLITNRDIITLWVARMVLAGLYNVGEVPFSDVYIHPKILDGYGEGMSKSKGNGVDPIDVIEKVGADSLRFALAYLTTETQDIRMPVEFECPHCGKLIGQTKKNRVLPRLKCKECGKEFSTQWAETPEDMALPRGAVVSDRFDLARNFCNKLWNASRFAMMNLEGFTPGDVADDELTVGDRWILSRLATVTEEVTTALDEFRYADAARTLYGFAWDEFCSFYVEMVKGRLQDETTRPVAQRVLAHTLDVLLRLLHPMIPFLTEEVWQQLGQIAPMRGLPKTETASESIMIAPWPVAEKSHRDERIESQFGLFQQVLSSVREIRARQNVPPKTRIEFSVRCDEATAELLRPMEQFFDSMAAARPTDWGPSVEPPALSANHALLGMEIFVDLAELIDVEAELVKKRQELDKLKGLIAGKKKKLENENFTGRAPAEVVQKERDALTELEERHEATADTIKSLEGSRQ